MKILIFGRDGQVGSQLNQILSRRNTDTLKALDIADVDLAQLDDIAAVINTFKPDWLLNASAYTAVDKAESDAELAALINHYAVRTMAKTCAAIGAQMLHYSTDYVFDGNATEPYLETDRPNPNSVYGQTKLDGELAVLEELPSAVILRTAWVYAKQGNNFVNTMLKLAQTKEQISVVNDQFGSPTLADDLANASIRIIDKITAGTVSAGTVSKYAGVYHATGTGCTNWAEFAQTIFSLAGCTNITVLPISGDEYPTAAARPAWSVLSNQKLKSVFDIELPAWQDSLANCLNPDN